MSFPRSQNAGACTRDLQCALKKISSRWFLAKPSFQCVVVPPPKSQSARKRDFLSKHPNIKSYGARSQNAVSCIHTLQCALKKNPPHLVSPQSEFSVFGGAPRRRFGAISETAFFLEKSMSRVHSRRSRNAVSRMRGIHYDDWKNPSWLFRSKPWGF